MGIRVSKRTLIAAIVGAGLLLTGVTSLTSGAATNTYTASGDSFTSSRYANATRGSSKELRTDSASNNKRYAYVKFVVPAQSGAITNATLKLNVKNKQADRFTIYRTTDFNEATLNAKNAPARGAQVAQVTPAGKGAISINVTSAVVANSTVSFTIVSAGKITNFSSREAGNNVAPSLTVTTTATASTVTTIRATTTTTRATTTTTRPSTTTTTRLSTTTTTSHSTGPITLPTSGTWVNATANLASNCGAISLMSPVPGTNKIIAAVAHVGLFVTTNNGGSWTQLGTGSGSAQINSRPDQIVYDPANSDIFWVAGMYGDGLYKTTNGGTTFQRLGNLTHLDSVSIDFTDPARRTLIAAGHEQDKSVHKSTDGGATWTYIGGGISGTGFTQSVYIIDANTYLAGSDPSWKGGTPGMFRTTNGGASWQQVSSLAANAYVVAAPDGTFYWNTSGGIARSTDQGRTWTDTGRAFGFSKDRTPLVLSDNRVLAITGNRIMISSDRGNNWQQLGPNLPNGNMFGPIYTPNNNALFAYNWDCSNAANPIQRLQ